MPSDPRYRQAAYERAKELRVVRRIARDRALKGNPDVVRDSMGRVRFRTMQTAQCESCPETFTAAMTTKRHRFCPACKALREKTRLARRWG